MITHCQICKREFWQNGVEPIPGDSRYCQWCAIKACEEMEEEMNSHSEVPTTNDPWKNKE